jgi:hypothetical protein
MAKANELGAMYTNSVITILLSPGYYFLAWYYTFHIKPFKNIEKSYIPSKYDFQQTTSIIIKPETAGTTATLYYKMRDKFTFPVGAGLTITDVIFDAYESSFMPE